MESTAGKAGRCHPVSKNSSQFYPGNRAEVFIWQNFPARLPRYRLEEPRSREQSQPALSNERIRAVYTRKKIRRVLHKTQTVPFIRACLI